MSAKAEAKTEKATAKVPFRRRLAAQDEIVLRLKTLQQEADQRGEEQGVAMRQQINRIRKMFDLQEIS